MKAANSNLNENSGTKNGSQQATNKRARSQRFIRAKTGCFTCRARRKKCDETRDATTGGCQRCLRSGIECLGFPGLRGAPLAAHSKKQKAVEDEKARKSARSLQADSASNRRSQNVSTNPPPSTNESTANFVLPLNDLLQMVTPPSSIKQINHDDNAQAMNAWLNPSIFQFAPQPIPTVEGEGGLVSISSPFPQLLFDDWISSDVLNSLANNANNVPTTTGVTPRIMSPFQGLRDEDHALNSLASFYAAFCTSWWLPKNESKSKRRNLQHVIHAVERRLRKSEIACTTVAAVAACYGFGNHQALFDNSTIESFRQSWERIYEVICDNKTSSLCAYLDWLSTNSTMLITSSGGGAGEGDCGSTPTTSPSSVGERNEIDKQSTSSSKQQRPWEVLLDNRTIQSLAGRSTNSQSASNNNLAIPQTSQGGPIEAQADRLFSFASNVLAKVAFAARQDQCTSNDILIPLEYSALIHVDVYLQASMDLALFAFTSRPEKIFHRELEAAGSLLESLLGRGQSVRLSEIDGVEAVGFRTFAWTDILNSVLSARCTRLHYLFENPDESGDNGGEVISGSKRKMNPNDDAEETTKSRRSNRGISISFGCPDDILVIFAHIANFHFQLRQARETKAIQGNGPEALPAWALHTACDLGRKIEESEKNATEMLTASNSDPSQFEQGQRILAAMWRHAAVIFLHTTAYRLGPLGKVNQERMKSIIDLWTTSNIEMNLIDNGNPAMPILFAAFIAQQKSERSVCREALKQIGRHERSRQGYREFVEKLWRKTDELGFAILWHDVLDSESASEIAIM
ncbi:hypothetical protein L7F22_067936 [Adiantum nelumboides]|nr:hypothetical protein [Adiantum nelumboides]